MSSDAGMVDEVGGGKNVKAFFVDDTSSVGTLIDAREIWNVDADEATSDDVEPRIPKPRRGAGRIGAGSPILVQYQGKTRPFADGAGLCSPGRWLPEQRSVDDVATKMRSSLLGLLDAELDTLNLACSLALGRHAVCPFSEDLLREGRRRLMQTATGTSDVDEVPAERQPFYLGTLAAVAKALGDPDWRVLCCGANSFQ